MSTRFSGFALLAILAAVTVTIPAFADNSTSVQNPILANTNPQTSTGVPITVTTDKTSYNDGDKLTI